MCQAPLYPDKAKIFHNSTFVLGYDTAVRLVMPKYYGGHDGMLLQLAGMSHLGCHVIVAGRIVTDDQGESSFKTFEDVEVPDAITDLVRVTCVHSCIAWCAHIMTVKPLHEPVPLRVGKRGASNFDSSAWRSHARPMMTVQASAQ